MKNMICDSPFYVTPKAALEAVPVPCGKCPNCKKRRVDDWAFRLMQEHKRATTSIFVTLTYDTDHVPITENGYMTLRKEDFQKFMKAIRKLEPMNLKYYAAGEYGTERKRPHYHAIMFNVQDKNNLQKAWSKGDIHLGNVTSDSVAYCLKYIDKFTDNRQRHNRDDREFEFSLMSKKLGDNFLTPEMIDYYKQDVTRLGIRNDAGYQISLPRYYRKKIFTDYEKQFQTQYVGELVKTNREQKLKLFLDLNPNKTESDFEDLEISSKIQRYNRFYSKHNQKRKDV